jgi:hypothetical protein
MSISSGDGRKYVATSHGKSQTAEARKSQAPFGCDMCFVAT